MDPKKQTTHLGDPEDNMPQEETKVKQNSSDLPEE